MFRDREIMFHVSTKLPFTEGDTQQVREMRLHAQKGQSGDALTLPCPVSWALPSPGTVGSGSPARDWHLLLQEQNCLVSLTQ